jgi:hypothetical protein
MRSPPVRFAEPIVAERRRQWRVLTLAWLLVAASCTLMALSLL